ncbi:amidohydrolase family protein [Solirhodobacter olei]|uniref:amidohydrolase family protein n=1 Tax=Solirhodobacter olei TaxID=2493082 RepID=UPI000FD7E754|nr:amidohydrolase family protein [Solirhodobacter olei]
MSVFDEPKIDCHAHILDPGRFPYDPAIAYHPSGQEIGTVGQMRHMMDCYGIRHTLLVQPNSGYGSDNSYLLSEVSADRSRFRGAAIVSLDAGHDMLASLRAQGVIGVAFNPSLLGTDFYANAGPLLERLAELDMVLNLQVEGDQIGMFAPWIRSIPVRVLIDHCGRPSLDAGLAQPGFTTLLDLAQTERVWVKVSGYSKFSRQRFPFEDCWPYVEALKQTFTPGRLVWSSDWPYLRAPDRQDVGPLLRLAESFFPETEARGRVFWHTPRSLLGF